MSSLERSSMVTSLPVSWTRCSIEGRDVPVAALRRGTRGKGDRGQEGGEEGNGFHLGGRYSWSFEANE